MSAARTGGNSFPDGGLGSLPRIFDDSVPRDRIVASKRHAAIPTMDVWTAHASRGGRPDRAYWKKTTAERLPDGTPGRTFALVGGALQVSRDMAIRIRPWRTEEPAGPPGPDDLAPRKVVDDPMTVTSFKALVHVGDDAFLATWGGCGLSGDVSVFALDEAAGRALPKKGKLAPGHPVRIAVLAAFPEPARSAVNRWLPEPDGYERWPFCLAEAGELGWRGDDRARSP